MMAQLKRISVAFLISLVLATGPGIARAADVDLEMYTSSNDAMESLLREMQALIDSKAPVRQFFYLMHELDEDAQGMTIASMLAKMADAGVDVQGAVDAHSSLMTRGMAEELQKHGVKFKAFRPVNIAKILEKPAQLLRNIAKANSRFHEKIVYTRDGDQVTVRMGSRNWTKEYYRSFQKAARDERKAARAEAAMSGKKLKEEPQYSFNDTEIRMSGQAEDFKVVPEFIEEKMNHKHMRTKVSQMQFKASPKGMDYAAEFAKHQKSVDDFLARRQASKAPLDERDIIRGRVPAEKIEFTFDKMGDRTKREAVSDKLVQLIREAKQSVVINNPYIITVKGEPLYEALIGAGPRLKEKVIKSNMLGESDHDLPSIALKAIVPDLVEQGWEIWGQATPNTLHEKLMVIDAGTPDGKVANGSGNFDGRSRYMNSEALSVIHDAEFSGKVADFYRAELGEINRWAGPGGCAARFSEFFMGTGYPLNRAPRFGERLIEGWTRLIIKVPFIRNMY